MGFDEEQGDAQPRRKPLPKSEAVEKWSDEPN